MTLKCERGFDSEVRKIQILSTDYSKIATLLEDRHIEIHAQFGKHFKIRIPRYGRDMVYDKESCELFSVGSSNEIYRLNLFKGQFQQPFTSKSNEINACCINNNLSILATAGLNGLIEIWDLRDKFKISELPVIDHSSIKNYDFSDMTSIEINSSGLNLAAGNHEGIVYYYDLRYPKPLYNIKHSYNLPIKKIKFHEASKNIISIDKKLAKFSNMNTGKSYTNIETKNDINDFSIYKDSGLGFFACEEERMQIYFIPNLGTAPNWCSFLENITEELEETKEYNIYEDFKFLTMNDLEQLTATNFIGSKLLKPYLNGYLMEWKLYSKLKALSEPFAYDEYMKEQKEEKLKKLYENRIVVNRNRKVKVNKRLLETNDNLKEDNRFSKLFTDTNYEVDLNSDNYKSKANKSKKDNETNELFNEENKKNDKETNDKIVNPKLVKLKEKVLQKKRKNIDKII